jgi:hypothetical protein
MGDQMGWISMCRRGWRVARSCWHRAPARFGPRSSSEKRHATNLERTDQRTAAGFFCIHP